MRIRKKLIRQKKKKNAGKSAGDQQHRFRYTKKTRQAYGAEIQTLKAVYEKECSRSNMRQKTQGTGKTKKKKTLKCRKWRTKSENEAWKNGA